MDLPSDSDESDVDFVPDGEISNSDVDSEADADKETEEQYENELDKKSKKRAAKSEKGTTKRAKLDEEEIVEKTKEDKEKNLNPEEVKKYEDDLWASFLDTPTRSKNATIVAKEESEKKVVEGISKNLTNGVEKSTLDVDKSAGSSNLDTKKQSTSVGIASVLNKARSSLSPIVPLGKKPAVGGGLASVLNKLGKKDKVSTLEKSKMDWMSFKKDEGLDEEIQTHNRGKAGYLERQDFLQRTDVRQFEIEKKLRLNKRSSR